MNLSQHILYEDDYILVVNKPCGLMVEPDRNGHPNLLYKVRNYIKTSLKNEQDIYAQHIHRLDRPVSGIILFAKQKQVLRNLSEQFAQRRVRKEYQAVTNHSPQVFEGTVQHWHRKEKKKAVLYKEEIPFTELAKLSYNVAPISTTKFLWSIELHTGKFHQIRAQLASLNCPIQGDKLYGSEVPYGENSIALHAFKLSFSHPITHELLTIESIKNWEY